MTPFLVMPSGPILLLATARPLQADGCLAAAKSLVGGRGLVGSSPGQGSNLYLHTATTTRSRPFPFAQLSLPWPLW